MRVALSTHTRPGRYPRWGYLDKFAVNLYMARAVASTLVVQTAVLAAYAAWQRFTPQRQVPRRAVTHMLDAAWIGGHPVPPPSLALRPRPTTPLSRLPARHVKPIPADDIDVRDDHGEDAFGASGVVGAEGSGDDVWGPEARGSLFDASVPTPTRTDFVAFEAAPQLVTLQAPDYPDLARQAGVEGRILVLVWVGEDGFVHEARLADEGIPMLNEAALEAARTAVFKPAVQADRPVAAWIVVPIEFDLHG